MSRKLLVATTNKKKLQEFRELFAPLKIEIVDLSAFPAIKEVEETGKTFEENAVLKAQSYAKQTGLLTLGEDSGLCCDALEGAPGVYSARFAGEGKSDDANNQKLLRLMENIPDNCRGAHYTSAIAVASPDKLVGVVTGEVHGILLKEMKGTGGFGYDPMFYYPPYKMTFGEASAEMKHKVSHRFKALEKTKAILEKHFGPG